MGDGEARRWYVLAVIRDVSDPAPRSEREAVASEAPPCATFVAIVSHDLRATAGDRDRLRAGLLAKQLGEAACRAPL